MVSSPYQTAWVEVGWAATPGAGTSGLASEYVQAFSAANELMDRALVEVLGQLACFEIPTLKVADPELSPGPPQTLRFAAVDNEIEVVLLQPGALAWLDDSVVRDAVIVTGMSFNWAGTGMSTTRIDAELLSGTAMAWRDAR